MDKDRIGSFANEANAGIAFANVQLTVGIAMIGFLLAYPPLKANVGLSAEANFSLHAFSLLIVISGFLASLFYANVHGNLRLERWNHAYSAMSLGNAFTEYLGFFPILLVLPIFIYSYTGSPLFASAAVLICILGCLVYHLAQCDLLSRWCRGMTKWSIVTSFCILVAALAEAQAIGNPKWRLGLGLAALLFCMLLAAIDWVMTKKLS